MKRVKLLSLWSDKNQRTGVFTVLDDSGQPVFACLSIERGDRENQKNISNVPKGIYPLVLEYSPRFKRDFYELKNVQNRSECKIHPANYWHQLNGCIALGIKLKDLNKDGYYDVTDSRRTVEAFHRVLKGIKETTIEIV